jgi:hypothetical protein
MHMSGCDPQPQAWNWCRSNTLHLIHNFHLLRFFIT